MFTGTPAAGGSAILLISSGAGTVVDTNDITGDTDVGINVVADQATIVNNRLVDTSNDDRNDVGIVNVGCLLAKHLQQQHQVGVEVSARRAVSSAWK